MWGTKEAKVEHRQLRKGEMQAQGSWRQKKVRSTGEEAHPLK